jgi:hypothetical protein
MGLTQLHESSTLTAFKSAQALNNSIPGKITNANFFCNTFLGLFTFFPPAYYLTFHKTNIFSAPICNPVKQGFGDVYNTPKKYKEE